MSGEHKAVFLSYASQDAEAAKRICDALRQAGVEVWFDQNELVGGDQWDAKIRRQISSCALFVPVISANTQARLEGYFRLEWKLAAQRTHTMADEKTFLLPVVIDATRDGEAKVPAEFKSVQWTKLMGGETPAGFVARVQKLLSGESEIGRDRTIPPAAREQRNERGGISDPALHRTSSPLLRLALGGLALLVAGFVAYLIFKPRRSPEEIAQLIKQAQALGEAESAKAAKAAAPAGPAAAPALSEARQLVEKAWQLSELNKNGPDGLRAAADLAQKATQLDSTDGEVWATAGMVDINCWVQAADRTEKREEMARSKILRATSLAPRSVRARLAEAKMLTELDLYPDGGAKAEAILRELNGENLTGWEATEVRGVLGLAIGKQGRGPESARFLEQAGQASAGWMNAASWAYLSVRMFPEALAAARRQTELDPSSGLLQQVMIQCLREDLAAALAALDQLPAAARTEEVPASARLEIAYYLRDAAQMQATARSIPGDYVTNVFLGGPKAALNGHADFLAGRTAAAKVEWEAALAVVDQRLAADRTAAPVLQWRLRLLALLGRPDEAEPVYQILQQLHGGPGYRGESQDLVMLGRKEAALVRLEAELRHPVDLFAHLGARFDPMYDPLRGDPRFEKLLRDTLPPGAKPFDDQVSTVSEQPAATNGKPPGSDLPPSSPRADTKSVAVLAFTNLSDDKGNEYFSDGISEELLNVLAKVPGLKVTARTSSFHFKGKDTPIPDIAKQLGVAYVIEGSVQKAGDKIRITAQLIKAADGFQVWSDKFDRDLKDIFALQDEIAGLIAKNLQLRLDTGRPAAQRVNPAAYTLVLQARFFAQQESAEGRRQAVQLYRQAIAAEPGYALAWAELGRVYAMLGRFYGGLPMGEAMQEARVAAEQALKLNPDEPSGLNALGWVQRLADWDWPGARQSFLRAVELAPDNPTMLGDAAVLLCNIGRADEAIAMARQAVERDPLSARAHFSLGDILASANHDAESVEVFTRGIELAPSSEVYRAVLGCVLARLHRLPEAQASLEREPNEGYRLMARAIVAYDLGDQGTATKARDELIAKSGVSMAGWIAIVFAHQNLPDQAFDWFGRAAQEHDRMIPWLKSQWVMVNLRNDARWPVFLHKVRLADEPSK